MPRSGPGGQAQRGKRPPHDARSWKVPQYLTELRTKTLLGVASELLGQLSEDEFGFAEDFQIISRRNGVTRSPRTLSAERPSSRPRPSRSRSSSFTAAPARLGALFLDEGFGSLE